MNPLLLLAALGGFGLTGGISKIGRQFDQDPLNNPSPMEWGQTAVATGLPFAGRFMPGIANAALSSRPIQALERTAFVPQLRNEVQRQFTGNMFPTSPLMSALPARSAAMQGGINPTLINAFRRFPQDRFGALSPMMGQFAHQYPISSLAGASILPQLLAMTPPDYSPPSASPVSPYLSMKNPSQQGMSEQEIRMLLAQLQS